MKIVRDNSPERQKKPWRKTWQSADGKQRRKYFATELEASEHDHNSCKLTNKVNGDWATMTKRDRHLATLALTEAKEHDVDLVAAVRYYKERHSVKSDKLFSDALKLFWPAAKGYRPKTIKSLTHTLTAFKLWRDVRLSEYTRADLLEFLRGGEVAAQTRHNWLQRLNRFFNWAKREGYIADNPGADIIPSQDLGVVPPREITFFTCDEVERLMGACHNINKSLIPYFTLGLWCGLRPGEMNGEDGKEPVTWDCITIDDDITEVNVPSASSKTSEPRQVEISRNAQEWLALGGDLPPKIGTTWARRQIAQEAGVEWAPDIMRHTFASYHCRMYRQPERLKLEMGHAGNSDVLMNHYKSGKVKLTDAKRFWNLTPREIKTTN